MPAIPPKRNLQLVVRECSRSLTGGVPTPAISVEFITWTHREFFQRLPDEFLWVETLKARSACKSFRKNSVKIMLRSAAISRQPLTSCRRSLQDRRRSTARRICRACVKSLAWQPHITACCGFTRSATAASLDCSRMPSCVNSMSVLSSGRCPAVSLAASPNINRCCSPLVAVTNDRIAGHFAGSYPNCCQFICLP